MYKLSDNQIKNFLTHTFEDTTQVTKDHLYFLEKHTNDIVENLKPPITNYKNELRLLFAMLQFQKDMIDEHQRFLKLMNEYDRNDDYKNEIYELDKRKFYLDAQIRGLSVEYVGGLKNE